MNSTTQGAAETLPPSSVATETPPTTKRDKSDYRLIRTEYLMGIVGIINGLDYNIDDDFKKAINIVLDTGISQADLADKIGVSRPSISRWALSQRMPRTVTKRAVFRDLIDYVQGEIERLSPTRPKLSGVVNGAHQPVP